MNIREVISFVTVTIGLVTAGTASNMVDTRAAIAADIPASSIKFTPGVTVAPEGYETTTTMYVVANPTDIYSDHYFFSQKMPGELKRGEPVDVIAKVKGGWEWILVGKNGTGIGYVSISMLSPKDEYIP